MEAAPSLTNDGLRQLRLAAETVESASGDIGNVEGKSDSDKFTEDELKGIDYKGSTRSIKKSNLKKLLIKVMEENSHPFYVQNNGWGPTYYKCLPNPDKINDTKYSVIFYDGNEYDIDFNDSSTKFYYYPN